MYTRTLRQDDFNARPYFYWRYWATWKIRAPILFKMALALHKSFTYLLKENNVNFAPLLKIRRLESFHLRGASHMTSWHAVQEGFFRHGWREMASWHQHFRWRLPADVAPRKSTLQAAPTSVSVKEIFQRVADARCLRLGSQSEKLSESLTPYLFIFGVALSNIKYQSLCCRNGVTLMVEITEYGCY